MKNRWNFQLLPTMPHVVAKGYRMDAVGEQVEKEVNDALPGYLKFHGVNKIVLKLGPNIENVPDYVEILGVGSKQWPDFDLQRYVDTNEAEKRRMLCETIVGFFAWIERSFNDAVFVRGARSKVPWLSV